MSFRLEMLQVARLAPTLLGDAVPLVEKFLLGQMNEDGGFQGRDGKSDIYYTLFGIEGLMALQVALPLERLHGYLSKFTQPEALDFVHLCCLVRAWSACGGIDPEFAIKLGRRLDEFRTPVGGYHQRLGASHCSAYGCLLGYDTLLGLEGYLGDQKGASPLSALGESLAANLTACLSALRAQDGGYANEPGLPFGTTPATAAATSLHRHLRRQADPQLVTWLLQQANSEGGFRASPQAPMPDLLSTAVALHALDGLQADYRFLKEPCLDFIDTLWSSDGGFHGNWADDTLDCEYTYYGLLALGHLSL